MLTPDPRKPRSRSSLARRIIASLSTASIPPGLRTTARLASVLALPALVTACTSGARVSGTGELPIGAAIALTGNASVIGQDQRIGLELAQKHFSASNPKLKLLLEDGGSDEGTATNAFRTLIGKQVVALIGPSLSQQAFAVDPIADRAGVPVIGPSNTAKGIPQIGRAHV